MRNTKRAFIGLAASVFGTAALLGGALGVMAAPQPQNLSAGSNFIGGPLEVMSPETFTGCLPAQQWNSIYIWDAPNQQWKHYINPTKVPDYVNSEAVGGIGNIPRFAGVAVLLDGAIQGAIFPQFNSEACD